MRVCAYCVARMFISSLFFLHMQAIQPSTGEVFYDEFLDDVMRQSLETMLLRVQVSAFELYIYLFALVCLLL